ncbi:MAG: RNA methyltransferase, partial [Actinomycetota bacterium]|nr:RNA methyltransferase [Actinomycetota bacterium]
VYLHGVSDPGNVGAVLRSAQAFGASSVVLGPGAADPYSPKAVRASMGAIFAVPVMPAAQVADLPGSKIALVAGAGVALADVCDVNVGIRPQRDTPPATLLIGAEREGLPDELVAQADHVAHIPIATNSLNAAMAATVALYELTRMRAA